MSQMIEHAPAMSWMQDDLDRGDKIAVVANDLLEREIESAWASMLGTEAGRMIAWSILDKCHVFSSTYTGNAGSNFLEGERSVGLKVLKQHVLPFGSHVLSDMMEEAAARHDRLMNVAMGKVEQEEG